MHLELARRLLDELAMEAIQEKERIEKEEEERKKKEEREKKRLILPHPMGIPRCEVKPEARTPPQAAAAVPQTQQPAPVPQLQQPQQPAPVPQPQIIHPRVWGRRRRQREETEDWGAEANHPAFALPVGRVNWEGDWARRCVCGARPGRCRH